MEDGRCQDPNDIQRTLTAAQFSQAPQGPNKRQNHNEDIFKTKEKHQMDDVAIAEDCDDLASLNVHFEKLPPDGKFAEMKLKEDDQRVLRQRRSQRCVQNVEISREAYKLWQGVGRAQGLSSDTQIASFLLQHYESTKTVSSQCVKCQAVLNLPLFCSKCSPPPVSRKCAADSAKTKTVAKKVRKQVKRKAQPIGKSGSKRRLGQATSLSGVVERSAREMAKSPDKTLDSIMDVVVAENVDDDDDLLLLSLTEDVDVQDEADTEQEARPVKNGVSLSEDSEKRFACGDCGLAYTRACSLKVHKRKHTGEKPFACHQCNATFSLSASLIVHKRTHTGEKPFVCEECGAAFSISSALKQHHRKHTGEKPYKCSVCGSAYSRSDSLKVHMRTHSGYKPFVCEECGATFARLYCLIAHKKKHTGERPYRCEECGATFTQSGKLNIHMRKHTGDRPFQCELCGAAFTQSDRLKTHMRTHTGYKPFTCSECLKGFSHPHSLKVHMRTHTGDKPYKCEVCSLSFADPSYFRRHKAKHTASSPAAAAPADASGSPDAQDTAMLRVPEMFLVPAQSQTAYVYSHREQTMHM